MARGPNRTIRLGLLLGLGLVLGLAPGAVADDRIDLKGRVLDDAGEPMAGIFVMTLEGHRRVPPFIIRPKAFGLPLPNIRVTRTDDEGRFVIEGVRPGEKTICVGEESLLLFGTAARRHVEADERPLVVEMTGEEVSRYLLLADDSERAQETVEDILVELDVALGWYMEARHRLEDLEALIRDRFGMDRGDEEGLEADRPREDALAPIRRARERIKTLIESARER